MQLRIGIAVAVAAAAGLAVPALAGTEKAAPATAVSSPGAEPAAPTKAASSARAAKAAPSQSDMKLHGGQDGTVFGSLTVEGEDRVHFDIERPSLELAIDPSTAPGLDWGSATDVLDRAVPDAKAPFLATSTQSLSPYLGRPWVQSFVAGDVARFRPQVDNVE